MRIKNEEDYKAALHELDQLIKDIDEAGGFDNISKEMENQLEDLSDDIWAWENKDTLDLVFWEG